MKKIISALTILLISGADLIAQTRDTVSTKNVHYHFFTNNIPSDFNFPVIGLINHVNGDHSSIQIGLVNSTSGDFNGAQAGLINRIGRDTKGVQTGFINSTGRSFYGIESGFVNNTGRDFIGIQQGFINFVGGRIYGLQQGFINSNTKTIGVQVGFINSSNEGITGVQYGFINSTGHVKGLQIGFINNAKSLNGLQLGFINSVDRVEKGLPIGFLSFVKHGGYKAIEVSYNNIYPFNVAFKTGVRTLYTYPILAYDWRLADDQLAFGYGIGSNLDIKKNLFINPEFEWLHQISLDFNHYTSLKVNFGCDLDSNFEILAGPALVWQFKINADDFHKNYTVWNPDIVAVNEINFGFNVALRYKFQLP